VTARRATDARRRPPASGGAPSAGPRLWRWLPSVASAASLGCGGGLPLLHPARTLAPGDVRAAAGFSGQVAVGDPADALRDAANEAAANPSAPAASPPDPTYARGALVAASVAPGIAPFAGARVGVGGGAEGGLAYTGRGLRADVRRSFDLSPSWALSVGAGGSAVLYGRQGGGPLAGLDLGGLHGWGVDVPVVVGFASDGDLYMVWVGARGGWEHAATGDVPSAPGTAPGGATAAPLSATRFWGGGLLGAAVGFRHVHVALEIDTSYASVAGDFGATHARVTGATLAPAGAVWWRF